MNEKTSRKVVSPSRGHGGVCHPGPSFVSMDIPVVTRWGEASVESSWAFLGSGPSRRDPSGVGSGRGTGSGDRR